MKFQILSHAGLLVEHKGIKVLTDPWLLGSCYWRSWWNFPEPPRLVIENIEPDYIYLTHLHWDHFHGPSLRKLFNPDVKFIVPKVQTTRMVDDLRWLGFTNIFEIPHGKELKIGDDFHLASYQFGLGVDSAVVFSGGGTTILNANDCKLFGMALKQLLSRFPKIDFALRSHSNASPIPYCVNDYRQWLTGYKSAADYIDEFCRFCLSINARYAVPFASNHCFLRKDTVKFNEFVVTPDVIPARYSELALLTNKVSECVVMTPGSTWSQANGFDVLAFDYSRRSDYILAMLDRNALKLEEQYNRENDAVADFRLFSEYFNGFIRSIPWVLRKIFRLQILFRIVDRSGEHLWLIDMVGGRVKTLNTGSLGYVTITTPAFVLNDCCSTRMFSTWTPSKLLRIYLRSDQDLKRVNLFFFLLDFYELDILPVRKNFSWRAISNRFARWREGIEALKLLVKYTFGKRRFQLKNHY